MLRHALLLKLSTHAVILYLYLKGKTGKEIHGELADVYGSSAPCYVQVKFWVREFKLGRTSLEVEARARGYETFFMINPTEHENFSCS